MVYERAILLEKNRINMSNYQKLSEEIIRECSDKVDWNSIPLIPTTKEEQDKAEIKTTTPIDSCSCNRCKGTGIVDMEFFQFNCDCPIGQSLNG